MNTFTLPVERLNRSIARPAGSSTPTLTSTHNNVPTRRRGQNDCQPTSHCSPYPNFEISFHDSETSRGMRALLPNKHEQLRSNKVGFLVASTCATLLHQHLRQMFIFILHHPDTNVMYTTARKHFCPCALGTKLLVGYWVGPKASLHAFERGKSLPGTNTNRSAQREPLTVLSVTLKTRREVTLYQGSV